MQTANVTRKRTAPRVGRPRAASIAAVSLLIGRRALQLALLLFLISTGLFFALQLAGDPALVILGESATPEQLALVREYYGFDQPLIVQYFTFLQHIAMLEFGDSYRLGAGAMSVVLTALPATIDLTLTAMSINVIGAILIGSYLGTRSKTALGRTTLGGVLILQGIPSFVVGLILIQLVSVNLGWLPSFGRGGIDHLILPAITLATLLLPSTVRVIASAVEDCWEQPYVRTALSFGLSRRRIMLAHVLPNGLLGAIGLLGVQFGLLMGGSLVIEVIFSWPGLGMQMVDAARLFDFPVLQAGTFVIAIAVFIGTTLADLLVPILDPRVGKFQ